jgi:hypothetical protein
MIRGAKRSPMTTAWFAFLLAAIFGLTTCDAAPVNCPSGIEKFNPKDGDLLIGSAANTLRRYRNGHDTVQQLITLKPDAHISFYYYVVPDSPTKPMIFALIRGYTMRSGKATSLDAAYVHVSNSISADKKVPAAEYVFFHEQKRDGPNSLRDDFHMLFHQHAPFYAFLNPLNNSYDDIDNPKIYALPHGDGFKGFKARMQRISGFPEGAQCVVFTLFDHKRFADAVASIAMSLIALSDKGHRPYDLVKFSVNFAAAP